MMKRSLSLSLAFVFLCIPSGWTQDSRLSSGSDLVDALVNTDPTSRSRSGTGSAYHNQFGPKEDIPTAVPLDDYDPYYGDSAYYGDLRSPIYGSDEDYNSDYELPSDLDAPMDSLDAPITDSLDY